MNRPPLTIRFDSNSQPLWQLKVIQEMLTLIVFSVFAVGAFHQEAFRWNYFAGFACIVGAVFFVFAF